MDQNGGSGDETLRKWESSAKFAMRELGVRGGSKQRIQTATKMSCESTRAFSEEAKSQATEMVLPLRLHPLKVASMSSDWYLSDRDDAEIVDDCQLFGQYPFEFG